MHHSLKTYINPFHFQVKIYQVLDPDKLYTVGGLRLLDAKRISVHTHGWLVFQVKKAVEEWVNGSSQNNGQY